MKDDDDKLTPTRTKETEARYLRRAEQLLACAHREGYDDVVEWFKEHAKTLKRSSFTQYKASLSFWLQFYGLSTARLDEVKYRKPLKKPATRTSAHKMKYCPEDELAPLISKLMKGGRTAVLAAAWLRLSRRVGLRPREWPLVRNLSRHSMEVANLKTTNGRSHGLTRSIALDLDDDDFRTLEAFVAFAKRNAVNWNTIYDSCARAVRRANRQLNRSRQKRITLSSGRHQVVADSKAAGRSPIENAALLGHRSPKTANRHYGRRSRGTPGNLRVAASPADVARVQALQTPLTEASEAPLSTSPQPPPSGESQIPPTEATKAAAAESTSTPAAVPSAPKKPDSGPEPGPSM